MPDSLVEIRELTKNYTLSGGLFNSQKRIIHAVNNIDLLIFKGETLGLVGESGCGKSTLARLITRLEKSSSGFVDFKDENIFSYSKEKLKAYRRNVQIIFQDPYSSLNPRLSIGEIIAEDGTPGASLGGPPGARRATLPAWPRSPSACGGSSGTSIRARSTLASIETACCRACSSTEASPRRAGPLRRSEWRGSIPFCATSDTRSSAPGRSGSGARRSTQKGRHGQARRLGARASRHAQTSASPPRRT